MIIARFSKDSGGYRSFSVSGHAGLGEHGFDVACAAVSSAVQLTANGITETARVKAAVQTDGDTIGVTLPEGQPNESCNVLIGALHLHLTLLSEEYSDAISVITE
ncbi:MAG: ribosomal-processing cysteine protease Prp [Acetanaerobacterium sp.]